MNDMKDVIGDLPLHSLMIPGRHDAGAWQVYNGTESDDSLVEKYTFTQEENIFNQLVYGIRYLDIRVAHYPETKEIFWVNHGIVRIYPLVNLLNEILAFTRQFNEIILMDFHNFPVGFTGSNIHQKLYSFVYGKMGDLIAPKSLSVNVTANQLWANKRPIIWSYAHEIRKEKEFLWPNVKHAWGNVNTPAELENYLGKAVKENGCRGQFWSLMAEQTPKAEEFFNRPSFGLRGLAQEVNIPLTYWFQREEWYSKANIIATDYFLGNNIIQMSISSNQNRLRCS